MVLPIYAYGSPVLRTVCKDIDAGYPGLTQLIDNMWETMYQDGIGVGLAAPQVGHPIRLFMMDTEMIFEKYKEEYEDFPDAPGYKGVFINARIHEEKGDLWVYNEGCLSIPKIHEDVMRKSEIRMSFLDETFTPREMTFNGFTARVIQHEYDHIEGKLFIDHIKPLKRTLLKRKLDDISKGRVNVAYRMAFPK